MSTSISWKTYYQKKKKATSFEDRGLVWGGNEIFEKKANIWLLTPYRFQISLESADGIGQQSSAVWYIFMIVFFFVGSPTH